MSIYSVMFTRRATDASFFVKFWSPFFLHSKVFEVYMCEWTLLFSCLTWFGSYLNSFIFFQHYDVILLQHNWEHHRIFYPTSYSPMISTTWEHSKEPSLYCTGMHLKEHPRFDTTGIHISASQLTVHDFNSTKTSNIKVYDKGNNDLQGCMLLNTCSDVINLSSMPIVMLSFVFSFSVFVRL